jgi:hypothetical protein
VAIFDIAGVSIAPGGERHSAAVDPADSVRAASVQLTDPNGVWNSTVGNITRWGVQASANNGTFANTAADWQNPGSVFQDNLPFGSRDKSGGMPSLRIQRTDQNGNPIAIATLGVKLRLAIQVDATIVLGATIKTNADT